jgi:hypothetical protein
MAFEGETSRADLVRKVAALGLVVALTGLPVNNLFSYTLLTAATVIVFAGEVTSRLRPWIAAVMLCAGVLGLQAVASPPRIDEGHNVFLPRGSDNVFTSGLPPDVYRIMGAQFDALYPPAQRCNPSQAGCWQAQPMPDRTFAFSADGIFDGGPYSRRVSGIGFDDPVWLRLGFINDARYNWYAESDKLQRAQRDRRFWMGLHRWQVTMPYFVMYRFPAEFAGGQLCWRGDLVWEEGVDRFTPLSQSAWTCRVIEKQDVGRRIFGLGIKPGTLAIDLERPLSVALSALAMNGLIAGVIAASLGMLVRWRMRATLLPAIAIIAGLSIIAIDDASFIGGVRPFDGGDDGLFYDGAARDILKSVIAGEWRAAVRGGEDIFYYGGPGFRYLRALEHVIFGESYLGYLSLVLLLPIVVFALFQRFVPRVWALACTIVFVAVPVGAFFGTSFFHYAKYASRGYADPAAAIFALCGTLFLAGLTGAGAGRRFAPAFGAAFLLALAIFLRPNLAPYVGVIGLGAGVAALLQHQWMRATGLATGIAPAAFMPWHNWFFGGEFVLFSKNSEHAQIFLMPPSSWMKAVGEIVTLDWGGAHIRAGIVQLANWLSGPSESYLAIPLGIAAVLIVIAVTLQRVYDPWLRLIAVATLAQHSIMLVYATTQRYHLFTWLMTFLIVTAWAHVTAMPWLRRRFPQYWEKAAAQPFVAGLGTSLRDMNRATGG